MRATPSRGAISCGTIGLPTADEGTHPVVPYRPTAVLARFGRLAVGFQHRVGRPGECDVAFSDVCLQLPVNSSPAKLFELVMQIEHHRRRLEAPRRPAGPRMQADDEERFSGEAERKVRTVSAL